MLVSVRRVVSSLASAAAAIAAALTLPGASVNGADAHAPLVEKTLVVWAAPSTLDQGGGSALTVDQANPDAFDAIVFAEKRRGVWMAGSSGYLRSSLDQDAWPAEEDSPDRFTRLAIVYRDGVDGPVVETYRDDARVAAYPVDALQTFDDDAVVLVGPRHCDDQRDVFQGRVREARIYARGLSPAEVAALTPGTVDDPDSLWAWWDFSAAGSYEKTGRFNNVALFGGARIVDGTLEITGDGALYARHESATVLKGRGKSNVDALLADWAQGSTVPRGAALSARLLRERLLADPYRPGYHFAIPEDVGVPGDPNGCFYADGRYHLMYLYNRTGSGFAWGHKTSVDLVHWRDQPDAIGPGNVGEGCFSGGAFLDDDGTAWLSFWGLGDGAGGIDLARSIDLKFERWEKPSFGRILASTETGVTETTDANGAPLTLGSADPSNIWKKGGKYYVLTGNLCVLNKYGRAADSPADQQGDRLYLFESEDLQKWNYKHVFYQRNPEWTDASEDNMCPSFLPLANSPDGGEFSGKYLLLFIAHNKGCQYYVGTYDETNDLFLPEKHGRMTWVDNTFFAPEALVDDRGRQIMWAWLLDNPDDSRRGWSGVYGLPRVLWLRDDGELGIAPAPELASLRLHPRNFNVPLEPAGTVDLPVSGDSYELRISCDAPDAGKVGVSVRRSPDGAEETLLYYDADAKTLCYDSTRSGAEGRKVVETAPLTLHDGERLELRVFVDRCVVEVFANDRQAITRRVYPSRADALGVRLFHDGKPGAKSVEADCDYYEMAESAAY